MRAGCAACAELLPALKGLLAESNPDAGNSFSPEEGAAASAIAKAERAVSYVERGESKRDIEAARYRWLRDNPEARWSHKAKLALEALENAESSLASIFESGDWGMADDTIEQGFNALADIRRAIASAR